MSTYESYKKQVFDAAQSLAQKGFLIGTGGNVSMRVEGEELIAITPSSMDYFDMTVDNICVVNFEREVVEGETVPSVETGMHQAVYSQRPDVNVVIHTHQIYASIFTLINQSIPALFDEQVSNLGNEVAVVPYGLSGSMDLLENISAAVDNNCNAYVLQNHGALTLGIDMARAVRNVHLLEKTATIYYHALTTGKEISTLSQEIEETIFSMLRCEQRKEIRMKKKRARGKA